MRRVAAAITILQSTVTSGRLVPPPRSLDRRLRIAQAVAESADRALVLDEIPASLGALVALLEERSPGLKARLDSSAVNAAVNGEVVLHGRDQTPLADGDEVEFLVMFAGG